ncbi:uncharacterized protein THITE_2124720 [Thermothielavioides terrestris NRRL 8126]|uniref:Potassium channel tetramerisation-type BTB domain-containing protein n=1 Tax=Thermothielavioides terrestris (strain ATCC 38088 / NRRL 8126) TaxID=578455 RepID=G2RGH0_THETT|nr:uncharacterized protein THITE_2124720 [Thermothielavioides terrestris NRRL 8126]AEO71859.1 hypothetical protein THITE_2124720 [Thermothielavioides terrestris NRRL 8126]
MASDLNAGTANSALDERRALDPDPKKINEIPNILPHERVFPIQIGSELFKLSGASISSDAPSYFSQYFKCQIKQAEDNGLDISNAIRTLYIDRDPVTFRDISLHLQGYHIQPRDATHFVRLFADAQFYHLPKLVSQLYEESIFTTVGGQEFRVPRDVFASPGNTPNYFTLGFAAFFTRPDDLFPGLDREGLLRPPSIVPPSVPGRSASTFAELLHLLRGYPVAIRSEAHRAELLRDCRYFNFKGLEQRLIPHAVSFNLARGRDEIVLRLRDILKSGISVASEPTAADPFAGWVNYARPYVDERAYELVLEIGDESTRLRFPAGFAPGADGSVNARAEFFGETRTRVAKMLEVIATKLNLPARTQQPVGFAVAQAGVTTASPTPGSTPLSEDLVKAVLDPEASIVLDGRPWAPAVGEDEFLFGTHMSVGDTTFVSRKRRRVDGQSGTTEDWIVRTGQWRLRIQGSRTGKAVVECCLVAVKLDAYSSEQARNAQRPFLSG